VGQFVGHTLAVHALAVLPHGKLASGGWDNTIRIWDIATQRCESTLRGHDDGVYSLAVLSHGKLASGSFDDTIRIWNISSQQCEMVLRGHAGCIRALVQLSNEVLASASNDRAIRVWDVMTQQHKYTLQGHDGSVGTLVVLPHNKLASGCEDKTIRIWDLDTRHCVGVLTGHRGSVRAIALLAGGRLASGSSDNDIRVWNLLTQQCELTLTGHSTVGSLASLLPHNRLASGCGDGSVRVWNLVTGQCEEVIPAHTDGVNCLTVISMDTVVSGGRDSKIKWHQYDCCGNRLSLAEIVSSSLLSSDSQPPAVTNTGRSYRKWAINMWYKVDGTALWVHNLREHYKERSRLIHALRVGGSAGKEVDFSQYFVNLALVRHVDNVTREHGLLSNKENAVLSLDRGELYDRLFVEQRYCAVEDIFGSLQDRSQPTGWIRIVGRAGTGKTTLTHCLAYRWGQKDSFWDNRFDFVFRVKLNLLAQEGFFRASRNVVACLAALTFASLDNSALFDEPTIIYQLQNRAMVTLLLLDGFDEISSMYILDSDVKNLIDYALSLPNGILTSRPIEFPSEWFNKCFTQTYENIGLSEENVRSYVCRYFPGEDNLGRQSLIETLDRNPSMMKLAQIPVNLNAICGIWQENRDSTNRNDMWTVTSLYDRMVLSVLRYHRLKQPTEATKKDLSDDGLRNNNYKALNVLAKLAFVAFECGQTQTLGTDILNKVLGEQDHLLTLFREEWGVLREAEAVTASTQQTMTAHYFVHLTYQEFFVAVYFAEALIPPGGPAETSSTQSAAKILQGKRIQQLQDIQVLALKIRDNRHNPRYAVIWTFLAGLLSRKTYAEYADYYWDALLPALQSQFEDEDLAVAVDCGSELRNTSNMQSQFEDEDLAVAVDCGSELRNTSNSASGVNESFHRPDMIGVHPSSAILSQYGPWIREALFGAKECRQVVPTRLRQVEERLRAVLQWQLLCEDPSVVALGDGMTDSRQELEAKFSQHRVRRRQLQYDLSKLGGKQLEGSLWDGLVGYRSYAYAFARDHQSWPRAADLDNMDQKIRYSAMRNMCQHSYVEAVSRLQEISRSDPDVSIRAQAFVAYCLQSERTHDNQQGTVADLIETNLQSSEPELRRSAVLLLGARALYFPPDKQVEVLVRLRGILNTTAESACVRLICAKLLALIDNDQDAYRYLVEVLGSQDGVSPYEAISCLKDRASMIWYGGVIRQALVAVADIDTVESNDHTDVAVLLRRIRPEMYEKMDLELLSRPTIARGFVESLWLHMGNSARFTPVLQSIESAFLHAFSGNAEVSKAIQILRQPILLPLVTTVFEESFVMDNLNKYLADPSCQGFGNTSITTLDHCCDVVEDGMTLDRVLFGPGHCLVSGMCVGEISVADVRAAVTRCDDDVTGLISSNVRLLGLNKDMLVALRLYTLMRPPIYKLLNYPFYQPTNRDPGSLLNQLPFMKYLLQSYDAVFREREEFIFAGPAFRGMNTAHSSDYLAIKYVNWQRDYAVGKKLTFPSFTSVSLDMSKAEQYAGDGDGQWIIYMFTEVVGLRLGRLSSVIEQEVLLKPPAVFIIQKVAMTYTGTLIVTLTMDVNNALTYL
jgi:WD40 repeat protein